MKRKLLSLLCAAVLLLNALPAAHALEGEARRAADTLITLGLLEEKDYDLSDTVDLMEATVMLYHLDGGAAVDAPIVADFRDVPQWADAPVAYAVRRGWVSGETDTTFGPERTTMANDWFAMLLRMLGYRDDEGEFQMSEAALFARRIGLASRAYTSALTLGDMYESALDALRFPYKDGDGSPLDRLTDAGICSRAAVNALGLNRTELTARQVSDRHMSAVFSLSTYDFEEAIENREAYSDASGFFITSDGIALTNYHTIDNSLQAVATLITGESFQIERVLWYDVEMDLAVIRVSRTTTDGKTIPAFSYLELAGTRDVRPGDVAYALSNPLGGGLAVSEGIVSATERKVDRYSLPCVMTTADISPGSSGGALLNVYGHVLGVTSGAYRLGNSMYLAVPVDIVPTLDLTGEGETLAAVAGKASDTRTDSDN